IESAPGGVDVHPLDDESAPVVLKLLGAEFELAPFSEWAAGQPVLGAFMPRLLGFRPPVAPDPFESLVTSITAQQVSLFAAFAIRTRFIERYGTRGVHAYGFPAEDALGAATEADLVALGFSRRKAEYVVGLARARLPYDELTHLPDEEVKARLVAVRGLGEWTADWYLARHLARPKGWPAGDLGLRKAVSFYYGEGRELATPD